MANSKEMTGGAVFPLLFSFTMPLLLGNLLQQTYSLIDAAIVGKFLGINSLAAVGAAIGYGDVRGDRRCLRFLLPGYLAGDADTREYLRWGL